MAASAQHIDAVELEIVKSSLDGIVQEMQNSLFRTGYSTIVREAKDASTGILDVSGNAVAQACLPLRQLARASRGWGQRRQGGDATLQELARGHPERTCVGHTGQHNATGRVD